MLSYLIFNYKLQLLFKYYKKIRDQIVMTKNL